MWYRRSCMLEYVLIMLMTCYTVILTYRIASAKTGSAFKEIYPIAFIILKLFTEEVIEQCVWTERKWLRDNSVFTLGFQFLSTKVFCVYWSCSDWLCKYRAQSVECKGAEFTSNRTVAIFNGISATWRLLDPCKQNIPSDISMYVTGSCHTSPNMFDI
jgi:hypothetical protein